MLTKSIEIRSSCDLFVICFSFSLVHMQKLFGLCMTKVQLVIYILLYLCYTLWNNTLYAVFLLLSENPVFAQGR